MTEKNVESFLEAEELANRLLHDLSRLKDEAESYRSARGTLQEAGTGIAELASQLTGAAQQLDSAIKALLQIGTPEILAGQERTTSELAALRQELEGAKREISGRVDAQQEPVQVVRSELATARKAIGGLRTLAILNGVGLLLALIGIGALLAGFPNS